MKIELSFAELHAPLFLAGKNFGMKLDNKKHAGIVLIFDDERDLLVVGWTSGGRMHHSLVPLSNVGSMTPKDLPEPTIETKMKIERSEHVLLEHQRELALKMGKAGQEAKVERPIAPTYVKTTAQVSTPQSHVHAGPGHGDTGQDKARKVVL